MKSANLSYSSQYQAVSLELSLSLQLLNYRVDSFMQRLVDKIQKEFYHISDYIEINALDGNGGNKLLIVVLHG